MIRKMGIHCGIHRETDYHRYGSCKSTVGETFKNTVGHDLKIDGSQEKMSTGITEFKQPWSKTHFTPICDFGSKEIVPWVASLSLDLNRQCDLARPPAVRPRARDQCYTRIWNGSTSIQCGASNCEAPKSYRVCQPNQS